MKLKKTKLIWVMGLLFLFTGLRVFAENPSIDSIEERYGLTEKLLEVTLPIAKLDAADEAKAQLWKRCLNSSVELFQITKKGKLPAETFVIYPEYLSDKDKKTFKSKFKGIDFDQSGPVDIPLPKKAKRFSGSVERAVKAPLLRYHDIAGRELLKEILDFLLSHTDRIIANPIILEEKEEVNPATHQDVPLSKKRTVIELLSLAKEINPKVESESAYIDVLTTFFQLLGDVETVDTGAVYDTLIEEVYFRLIEKSAQEYQRRHNKIVPLFKEGGAKDISITEIDFGSIKSIIAKEKSDASFKAAAEQYIRIFRESEKEKITAVKKLETRVHRSVQSGMSGVGVDGNSNVSRYNSIIWRITNHYASVEKGLSLYDEISGLLKILAEADNISSVDPEIPEGELSGSGDRALEGQIVKHEKLLKEYQMRLRKARIERNSEEMEKNLNHIEYEVGLLESLRTRKVEQSIDYLDNNYRIFERQIDKYLSTGTLLPPEITGKYQQSFNKIREKYEVLFKERNDYSQKRRYKEFLDFEKQMGKISSDIEILYDRIAGEVEKQIEASQTANERSSSPASSSGPSRRMIPDRTDTTPSTRSNRDEANTFPFF